MPFTKAKEVTGINPVYWSVTTSLGGSSSGGADEVLQMKLDSITSSSGRRAFCNPCFHESFDSKNLQEPYTYVVQRGSVFDTHHDTGARHPYTPLGVRILISQEFPFDKTEFCKRALEAMTPTLETGFSAPNFLWELGEVKGLIRWWDQGRSFFRNFSQNNLQYSFGLLPFISDMKTLVEGLRTLDSRLSDLKKGAGQKHVRHYSETDGGRLLKLQHLGVDASLADNYLLDDGTVSIKHTATLRYKYQFPDIDSTKWAVRGFLDTIGLHLDAYTVWEAIPFSFVVDWFFSIGDFLKQFRKRWVDVHMTPSGLCVSRKVTYNLVRKYQKVCYQGTDMMPHFAASGKTYQRASVFGPILDSTYWPTTDGELTVRKIFLGALLYEQKAKLFR